MPHVVFVFMRLFVFFPYLSLAACFYMAFFVIVWTMIIIIEYFFPSVYFILSVVCVVYPIIYMYTSFGKMEL